jgi:hypothetical protein
MPGLKGPKGDQGEVGEEGPAGEFSTSRAHLGTCTRCLLASSRVAFKARRGQGSDT